MKNFISKLNNKMNLYISLGNYELAYICLIIKAGSNDDNVDQQGIAHIVEHMCLSYPEYKEHDMFFNNENPEINPNHFHYSGYTDFSNTVLVLRTENEYIRVIDAITLLKKMITGDMVKDYLISKIRKDIKEEYREHCARWDQQREITSFITNGFVNNLPIGNLKYIDEFKEQDLTSFIELNYTTNNLAVIIAVDSKFHTNIQDFINEFVDIEKSDNALNNEYKKKEPASVINQNNKIIELYDREKFGTQFLIYFPIIYRSMDSKEQFVRALFENLLKK
ncbi:insulinase family protein [Paenibacillus macerans]|uniref:Insulinase family protein n=1 Tax=Paenibacillus macerans TaxID=44252 RepID=A0A090YAY3_PAEMA|nr:insulinase family protein [Paenibacillus macerans]KFM94987.1 insulinase family protein [Paenibacillus macerans]MCY7560420.1 insulinase family protein [Paenibacillus macerans]MEC0153423.1 insulinase family protein [Paenibacillus macerans]SUD26038.1 Insulinase (Peptidase family M16) [Paenibacillus macerans]